MDRRVSHFILVPRRLTRPPVDHPPFWTAPAANMTNPNDYAEFDLPPALTPDRDTMGRDWTGHEMQKPRISAGLLCSSCIDSPVI